MFKKVPFWLFSLWTILLTVALLLFAWTGLNRYANGEKITGLAEFFAKNSISAIFERSDSHRFIEATPEDQAATFADPNGMPVDLSGKDTGFLLVSRWDGDKKKSVVELIRESDNSILHSWYPDIETILKTEADVPIKKVADFRTQAPLLLDDGSLIIGSGEGHVARVDSCGRVMWSNGHHFHHSIELWKNKLVIPSTIKNGPTPTRDDAYAIVNLEGEIEDEKAIFDILKSSDLEYLIEMSSSLDPVHLNDAEIIHTGDEFVRAGDVIFSSRHLSAIFMYRPDTDKVLWFKVRPWLANHDVDYIGDGVFSVVGNNNYLFGKQNRFIEDTSNVYFYEPSTGKVTAPYDAFMKENEIKMASQGVHRVLRDQDLFFEDSDHGALYRVDKQTNKSIWKMTFEANGKISALHWSRYYYPDELSLDWLENKNECSD